MQYRVTIPAEMTGSDEEATFLTRDDVSQYTADLFRSYGWSVEEVNG